MTIDGYKVYLMGMLEPTDPAVLVKYKNKLTFTDTLTNGMKIDIKSLAGVKFMNVDGGDVEFEVEVENDLKNDPESENIENINPDEDHEEEITQKSDDEANFREGCQYLDKCYRKNPSHRDDFSHPGDEDWLQGECEFGTNCYRENKAHKSRFTHSQRQVRNQAKKVKYNDSDEDGLSSEEESFDLTDEEEDEDFVVSDD